MTGHDRPLVLVADDNDDHRTMAAMYLAAAGFRVIEAQDGISAIGKSEPCAPMSSCLTCTCPA
jgi:CheY-like chemotaxis protein